MGMRATPVVALGAQPHSRPHIKDATQRNVAKCNSDPQGIRIDKSNKI
jgi:hypothetical protein